MKKWADYLISAVRYDSDDTYIEKVRVHKDKGDSVGSAIEKSRESVIDAIEEGTTFVTIYKNEDNDKWNKGKKVYIVTINATKYIKTVKNNIGEDNLENLPEF